MLKQVLTGVKVLDFGWALVGSLTGKYLADQGAEVIRIENSKRPGLERTNRHIAISSPTNPDDKPWFTYLNTSKYSLSLNLKHPLAQGFIAKLVEWADVVNENFSPGTMEKFGLGYEFISKIKPEIIMLQASIFGQTGPLAKEWGIDSSGNALSGRADLSGWPDRAPTIAPSSGAYGDELLPLLNAIAIIAALDYRRRTGQGQHIDASMLEVLTQQVCPALLDLQMNQHLTPRSGNRVPNAVPHGVYPCKGNDRWCAIAVFNDGEWASLCEAIGNPSWAKLAKFSTAEERKQNEDELDDLISRWTIERSPHEVMRILQEKGVAAGAAQNAQDIFENDPQLKHRGFLSPIKHPILGTFSHPMPLVKFDKIEPQIKTSPCLGEHNYFICSKILGMSDGEFTELLHEGLFD